MSIGLVGRNVGMTRIDPVMYKGTPVVPMEFLKSVLPEPSSLAENYTGKTSIGVVLKGEKNPKGNKYLGWSTRSYGPDEFAERHNIGIQGGFLSDGGKPGHRKYPPDSQKRRAASA